MRRLMIVALLPFLCVCAPAQAQEQEREPMNVPLPLPGWGTAQIVLGGDYVGKQVRISLSGRVVVDRRFTLPPSESGDRVPVFTQARDMWVLVEIEGCPASSEVRVALEPLKSSSLIFNGCSVRALPPK